MAIGVHNLPNQLFRIVARTVPSYTVLIVGDEGLGKQTLVNSLFPSLLSAAGTTTVDNIRIQRFDISENGFTTRLNIVTFPLFNLLINNSASVEPIVQFIDAQFTSFLLAQQQPVRSTIDDLRPSLCLYLVPPSGHSLRPIDVLAMKLIGDKVSLLSLIAKADTLTRQDLVSFKQNINACIAANHIRIYTPPHVDNDSMVDEQLASQFPLGIVASETGKREYIWGTVNIDDPQHSELPLLRNLLFKTHMHDLIETMQKVDYEAFRSQYLSDRGYSDSDPTSLHKKTLETQVKHDEEALRKRFTEQVRKEELRFRQWEQKLIVERDRLNKDLEAHHAAVKMLEEEIDNLVQKRRV